MKTNVNLALRTNPHSQANPNPKLVPNKATAANWTTGAPSAIDSESRRPIIAPRGSLAARELALALGADGRPDASGNYAARCPCPAHENGDRNASLSLKDGHDGRVLFYCFAGGSFQEIAAALRARGLIPALHPWRRP